jgi:hypothetical protein
MRVVSLLYHDVVPSGDFESSGFPGGDSAIYKLELSEFEKHLMAIHNVIDRPATVLDFARLSGLPTLLTFDDGGPALTNASLICSTSLAGARISS